MSAYDDIMVSVATPRELGAAMREHRQIAGLTQAELADRAHVSRQWLLRFEQGHPHAELSKLFALTHALNLNLELTPKTTPEPETDDIDLDQLLEDMA